MTAWSPSPARPSEGAVDVEVELTDRVTMAVSLLPTVRIDSVVVAPGAGGLDPEDLALADAVRADPSVAAAASGLAAACHAVEAPGSGRIWSVEGALRALQLIDLLDVRRDDAAERGVWAVWDTLSRVAAQALAEIPDGAQRAGGAALQLAARTIARRMEPTVDRLTAGRLRTLVDTWPTPREDLPDPGDTTMEDLESVLAADHAVGAGDRRGAFRSGPTRMRSADGGVALEADLAALVQVGLTFLGANVAATPKGEPGDMAWELRIPVRGEVARAYHDLMSRWNRWLQQTSGRAVSPMGDERAKIILSYGRLAAATHLPFSLDELLEQLALVEPAPPHLMDVVCTVDPAGGAARVGFLEELQGAGAKLDLVAVIPSERPPDTGRIAISLQADRTPFVTGRKRTIVNRLLTLRRDLSIAGSKAVRLARTVRELEGRLADPELVGALRAEVSAAIQGARPWVDPDVRALIGAINGAEAALTGDLATAVERQAVDEVAALCDQLARTRAYLIGLSA